MIYCTVYITLCLLYPLLIYGLMKLSLVIRMLEKRSLSYADGPVPVPIDDQFLVENVQRISICDTGMCLWLCLCKHSVRFALCHVV